MTPLIRRIFDAGCEDQEFIDELRESDPLGYVYGRETLQVEKAAAAALYRGYFLAKYGARAFRLKFLAPYPEYQDEMPKMSVEQAGANLLANNTAGGKALAAKKGFKLEEK